MPRSAVPRGGHTSLDSGRLCSAVKGGGGGAESMETLSFGSVSSEYLEPAERTASSDASMTIDQRVGEEALAARATSLAAQVSITNSALSVVTNLLCTLSRQTAIA